MRQFIFEQNHTKSIVIEKSDKKLSINLAYGDIIKITPRTFRNNNQYTNFLDKLQERYKLWEIDNCTCKPKKIRVWENNLKDFKYTVEELERISNINDAKLGVCFFSVNYWRSSFKFYKMFFNHSYKRMSDNDTNLMFSGETLAVVADGNYYSFRLDQRTMESEDSHIKGKI